MGTEQMKKLKIGYWPLSQKLDSAGDRRRLLFWAQARGHEITTDLSQKIDVIVASEKSDFNSAIFARKRVPIIFDLIDAYLSPLSNSDDLARGIAKRLSGQITGGIKPFSHHVRDFCINSDAVICSSIEQEELINRYNINTHVILDSHHEFPFVCVDKKRISNSGIYRILWEGQPATIRGVKDISSALVELTNILQLNFDFVTNLKYHKVLNTYLERNTSDLLKKDLSQIMKLIRIIPWTTKNLVDCARNSHVAMIPLELSKPMHRFKPENRLLIMWRLGLPCLTSPSPAYVRVAKQAGVTAICRNQLEWIETFQHFLTEPSHAKEQLLAGQSYLSENHSETTLLRKWDLAFESVMS